MFLFFSDAFSNLTFGQSFQISFETACLLKAIMAYQRLEIVRSIFHAVLLIAPIPNTSCVAHIVEQIVG